MELQYGATAADLSAIACWPRGMTVATTRPIPPALVSPLAPPSRDTLYVLGIALLVLLASCATLVLEIVGSRIIAPFVGVSLDTWTSIIGVVLAGVSLGNWIGGKLADRYPNPGTFALLFFLAGLTTLGILAIIALLGDGGALRPVPLLPRIFLLTAVLFFLPCFILSMVTPVAIRLMLRETGRTGRVVGLVYAVATMGSLVGTFATGFVLIAHLTLGAIVWVTGMTLSALGLASLAWWRLTLRRATGTDVEATDNGRTTLVPFASRLTPKVPVISRGLGLEGNIRLACALVVVSSFCTMAIELAASRVLAPFLGVSLYSWTGIIGVVLAGIAVGNYLGGRIADRSPRQDTLGVLLFLSGFASLVVIAASQAAPIIAVFKDAHPLVRIMAVTTLTFFLPVALLGTISPQVIKLAVTDVRESGRVSGRIYAWSTGGAIAGTFATGWWLISAIGVYHLLLVAALTLIVLAVALGPFWRRPALLASWVIGPLILVAGLHAFERLAAGCTVETNYFCIRVYDTTHDGHEVKALALDRLTHSFVKLGDPTYLGYEHEHVQAEVTRFLLAETEGLRVLVIGGGGYTYPRWVETTVPQATIEVVEIDPGVTEVAYSHLGLRRDTKIRIHHLDGRQFVSEQAPRRAYDLVILDAVNDLSVPYHLLTREFNESVADLLKPQGVYLVSVIDLYEDGQLLRSAVRTMMQTFPEVRLLAPNPPDNWVSQPFVILGSQRGIELSAIRQALQRQGAEPMRSNELGHTELRAYVKRGPQIVLTDQYAPVDNLLEPLIRTRI